MELRELNRAYLEEINPYLNDVCIKHKAVREGLGKAKSQLELLNHWIRSEMTLSPDQEILFFKVIKSEPLSHFIYFMKVKDFISRSPVIDSKRQQRFVKREMKEVNEFFKTNREFIEYCNQSLDTFDVQYFTRQEELTPKYPLFFLDPGFSTSHDTLLGQYKAIKLYIVFLQKQAIGNNYISKTKEKKLNWTGRKVDLIELIYALHASGAFNNGNASIKMIATYFQEEFGCPLGDFYRSYTELRYRKKSRTKFLEQLTEKLTEKMELEEG